MLIDSHAHFPPQKEITGEILKRANDEGVEKVIAIATNIKEAKDTLKLITEFDNLYAAIGIYPHEEMGQDIDLLEKELALLLKASDKIVGIGECGLDITDWADQRPIEQQIELFEMQILLAKKTGLPLVIHNRNGDELLIELLTKHAGPSLNGVAHCFATNWQVAKKLLDLNFYISFSGFITHNSKKFLLETVKKVPDDKFLIETDAPYIMPKGLPSGKNEPKNVRMIAHKIAEVKNLTQKQVEQITYANTCNLFNLN